MVGPVGKENLTQIFGRPADSVRTLTTAGGMLLLDTARNELTAYNESARHLWELVQTSDADPVRSFAAHYSIPHEIARTDVGRIVQEWQSRGLLMTGGTVAPPARAEENAPADGTRPPRSDWVGTLTCTIRKSVIVLAAETPAARQFIQIYFKHLETADARADIRIELREGNSGESVLAVDGVERYRTSDDGLLFGAVHQTVLQHIHPDSAWMAMVHGGAVTRNGKAVVLAAPSGSGKTTLIASLLPRGYDYFADDLVALSADGLIRPWPLPLSVKTGSWPVLSGMYPDWPTFPQHDTSRGAVRFIVPKPEAWDRAPAPVQALVFPEFSPGAAVALTQLTAFEAFQRLLNDRVWLGYPITEERVRRMLDWLGERPTYHLLHGNVDDAARYIEDIV